MHVCAGKFSIRRIRIHNCVAIKRKASSFFSAPVANRPNEGFSCANMHLFLTIEIKLNLRTFNYELNCIRCVCFAVLPWTQNVHPQLEIELDKNNRTLIIIDISCSVFLFCFWYEILRKHISFCLSPIELSYELFWCITRPISSVFFYIHI